MGVIVYMIGFTQKISKETLTAVQRNSTIFHINETLNRSIKLQF